MEIPVQNIYYLLCYAWKHLKQGEPVPLPAGEADDLVNLFALILSKGIQHEVRRGLHRNYVDLVKETVSPRGRIQFTESLNQQSLRRSRLVCNFDEFSRDVLPNRIIRSVADQLVRDPGLTKENRDALRTQIDWLHEIRPTRIQSNSFQRLNLPPRNRSYRFLINICELIWRRYLPGERGGRDVLSRTILRDQIRMHALFEDFVCNFYSEHLSGNRCKIGKSAIKWAVEHVDEASRSALPNMETDITIDGPYHKIILDCKFYQDALKGGRYSDKVTGSHLYQLLSYLKNHAVTASSSGWDKGTGILLYPVVRQSFDYRYHLLGHRIKACTVNLDRPWHTIHRQLLDLVDFTDFDTAPPAPQASAGFASLDSSAASGSP